MNRRVAVRGIIVHEGKMLALRLKQYKDRATNDANDYWCTPGGGVDVGEALLPALEREMVEELGIKPVVGPLLYVQQFLHGDTEQMELFFQILNATDYLQVDLDATTHGNIEIASWEFIDPSKEHILPAFLATEPLPTDNNGAPTKFFNYL